MPLVDLPPAASALVAAAFGLLIGSFLNVVIYRLPRMLERGWQVQCAELAGTEPAAQPTYNLLIPRSRCTSCGHPIGALENIPLLSYAFLRGKCAACKTPISARYPLVELLTGVLTALTIARFGISASGLAACVLVWCLIALTFIDFDTQFLPDNITLPLLWAGLFANVTGIWAMVSLRDAILGAIAGYLSLWTIYWAFKLLRGKEGMGYGDFKLLAAIGAWLGWQLLLPIVLLSSFVGAVVGLSLVVFKGRDHQIPLAFGPYLAIAGGIALFWGKQLAGLIGLR